MPQSGSVLADVRPSTIAPLPIECPIAPRPRLTARLDAAIRTSPVVIVSGEAGSGKTALVADWIGRPSDRPAVCWRSLRRGSGAVAELRDLSAGAGDYRVVVLDDVPVEPNDELDAALERLLGSSQGFALVILSSGAPALDLQRLGAGAQCLAIDSAELALDAEEIETTLTCFGITAGSGLVTAIADQTQGWAWGVRSVASRLARAASATGALHEAELAISGYLENSILRGLLPQERRLITESSMVGEVTAEHVISLAGDHRLLSLDTVTRTRGFVQVRADGSFTTHPLLRRHLLTELRRNPTSARAATRQAVRCAAGRGDLPSAVDIAVDGADWACAAELLVESLQVPRLLIEGPALPGRDDVADGLGAADPVLRAAVALGRSWPDVAEQALREITAEQALTEITAEQAPTEITAETGSTAVRLSRALVAMSLARWQGDPAAGLAEHRRAAALLPRLSVVQRAATPELVPLLHAHLAAFEVANGAPDRAKVSLERGARAFRPKPTPETSLATQVAAADCLGQLAWLEAVNGDLTSALRRAADVLTARPADSNEVGVVYAQLASVWCQVSRVELEPAAQRFESVTTRQSAPPDGALLPELAIAIGLTSARLAVAVGHGRIGYEIRQLCRSSSDGWQFDQQLRQIRAEAELDAGEPAAALRILADSGQQSADVYVLRARAWIQLGDRASVASALRVRPVEALSLLTQVQLELVEAWLAQAHGDQARLRSLIDRALRTAQREQLRAPISWAKPWLHDIVTADHRLLRLHGPFLASIRRNQPGPVENVARPTSTAPPVSALTEREIDILQRLGALSTNEEIAADLYLSPNTIKTHLRSLYRKLDVTRRSDAFRRGRALGLC